MRETLSLLQEENQLILRRIDSLSDDGAQPVGDSLAFRRRVEALVQDARDHFSNEERAMRAFAFPDYERHRHVHQRLLDDAERLIRVMCITNAADRAGMARFLRGWLEGHAADTDARLAAFLRGEKGAA